MPTSTTTVEEPVVPAKAVRDDPALESFGMTVVNGDKAVNVDLTRSGGLKLRMAKAGDDGLIEMVLDEKQADTLEDFIAIRRPRPELEIPPKGRQASRAAEHWRIAALVCGIFGFGTALAAATGTPGMTGWIAGFTVAGLVTGEFWRMEVRRS